MILKVRAANGEHALSVICYVLGVCVLRLLALEDGADDVHQDVCDEDEEDGVGEMSAYQQCCR